ncbi:hypothetical protein DRE_02797 [Drechslerella stenobrocha 248]|uniref:Uncharacterized protein n=1 Tax=Drechslerella stenobrocha 248 TaxID=1043628 RepID=W7IFI0_9PEZI|nr:hypothetical protein DRE_02797 [Drechslerella stenobrocha 248]
MAFEYNRARIPPPPPLPPSYPRYSRSRTSTAARYAPNIEFELGAIDPGIGAPNRSRVVTEQQRILAIFNDILAAQRIKILGRNDMRIPELASEEANREKLQNVVREMAEANVNKLQIMALMDNFGAEFSKYAAARDTVETQRQLNAIQRARMLGYLFLLAPLQRHLRICQASVVLAVGGGLGAAMAIWSGVAALSASMQAVKTAGLQCIVMGMLQLACGIMRIVSRFYASRYPVPSIAYGRDRLYVTRYWDAFILAVLLGIIAFGAWMWRRSGTVFVVDGQQDEQLQATATTAPAAAALTYAYTTAVMGTMQSFYM